VHRRQTPRAGAPREPQQERLGLVVARVAQRDRMGRKMGSGPFEERMSRRAGGRFQGPPFQPGTSGNILPFDADRPAKRFGKPSAKPLVFVGCMSQLMVEMGETDDAQLPFGLKVAQDMRQRDGIGSARKRYHDVGIATSQLVPADELSDAIEQLHHSRLERQVGLGRLEGSPVRRHPTIQPFPPFLPDLPELDAGGRIRTADPALMRRVLSPTELLRLNLSCYLKCKMHNAECRRVSASFVYLVWHFCVLHFAFQRISIASP
jgi:hypothetical protein